MQAATEKPPIEVWFDGLCKFYRIYEKHVAGLGYLIKRDGKTIERGCAIVKEPEDRMTNNFVRYFALIHVLRRIKELELDKKKIVIRSDSKIIVSEMKTEKRTRALDVEFLEPLYYRAKILATEMDTIFELIKKKENVEAQKLSFLAVCRQIYFEFYPEAPFVFSY